MSPAVRALSVIGVAALSFSGIGLQAATNAVSVEGITAVYDRMPGPDYSSRALHVAMKIRFTNASDLPLSIRLDRVYSSFEASKRGAEMKNLAFSAGRLCGSSGNACTQFTLAPGRETDDVSLLSSAPSPNPVQKTLFVTVVLVVGGDVVEVHGSSEVAFAD